MADNVLSPGAPLFLAHLLARPHYHVRLRVLEEFLRLDLEDWVAVCVVQHHAAPEMTAAPPDVFWLSWSSYVDDISWRSQEQEVEWKQLQGFVKPAMLARLPGSWESASTTADDDDAKQGYLKAFVLH